MQGVIKSYEPTSGDGIVVGDVPHGGTFIEYDLAADALDGSIFRMLRQGQRVVFDVNQDGRATRLRMGSEVDMGTPGHHG
jgi:CspA family cold shock protein